MKRLVKQCLSLPSAFAYFEPKRATGEHLPNIMRKEVSVMINRGSPIFVRRVRYGNDK